MSDQPSIQYASDTSFAVEPPAIAGRNNMVSCIMPTSNRAAYLKQSVEYFTQQDYPDKELVIVYNEDNDLPPNFDVPDNVRLIKTTFKSIGAKRNIACKHALGSIIAHWDDDDLYNTTRLSMQILPLLQGRADITGLYNYIFYDLETGKCLLSGKEIFNKYFYHAVGGGTLVFTKRVWEKLSIYPDISIAEDALFLNNAIKRRARLERLDGLNEHIYVRHTDNTWKLPNDFYLCENKWIEASFPDWAKPYEPFYKAIIVKTSCS